MAFIFTKKNLSQLTCTKKSSLNLLGQIIKWRWNWPHEAFHWFSMIKTMTHQTKKKQENNFKVLTRVKLLHLFFCNSSSQSDISHNAFLGVDAEFHFFGWENPELSIACSTSISIASLISLTNWKQTIRILSKNLFPELLKYWIVKIMDQVVMRRIQSFRKIHLNWIFN